MQKTTMMVGITLISGFWGMVDMKIIFLDVNGVLNCQSSKSSCNAMLGIDDDIITLKKCRNLYEIYR